MGGRGVRPQGLGPSRAALVADVADEVQAEHAVEMGERLELGAGRHIGPTRHIGQQIQDGIGSEIVDERRMRPAQQFGGDRSGRFPRPCGHLPTPPPQCPPGIGQRLTGERDGCAVGVAEQQQAHRQWIRDLRFEYARFTHVRFEYARFEYARFEYARFEYARFTFTRFECVRFEHVRFEHVRFEHVRFEHVRFEHVREIRGENRAGPGHALFLFLGRRADLPHVDPDPVRHVVGFGATGDHMDVGRAAERPVRMMACDDDGWVDAEHRHHAVERPGLIR
ncbi:MULTISPECIES: pentapeptide repeat-containing protein [unclassified Streptomyces]|uniref:pentapeptide repeat-containing protein n=1 Tax=unclassified Streptomyces TaxID=2593676 RepID=UPI0036ED0A6A